MACTGLTLALPGVLAGSWLSRLWLAGGASVCSGGAGHAAPGAV